MLHIGLQVKDKEELNILENIIENIGIKGFKDFDIKESGLYFMSVNPIETKTIDDFSDEVIEQEYFDRGL